MQVTLKERSPKRPASWAVKNQQSKKRNADSDTNTSNGGHRGSNHDKFRQGANKKDHWATAKQRILETHTNNEDTQREDTEIERRRRRRRKDGDSSSTGDGNAPSSSKVADTNRIAAEEAKTRRVPRKLPLQSTVEQSQSWSDAERRNSGTAQIKSKTRQTPVNNDAQNCCEMNEARSINRVTRNGLQNWEAESSNGIEETTDANIVRNAMWPGEWRPPPDDVQPCSSKTIDPYSFA